MAKGDNQKANVKCQRAKIKKQKSNLDCNLLFAICFLFFAL